MTTVSRVLNHRPDVNAATREKVERVMVECNFVGNANARSLKQLDGDVAALILRGRSNPFLSGLAETMLQFAREADVSFLMESIDEKDDEFQTALRLMHEKRARGFIFIGQPTGRAAGGAAGTGRAHGVRHRERRKRRTAPGRVGVY